MKAFHTIAVPHDDITNKRLTMDVFAADLWDTFKNRGPEEYTDSKTFFKKTRITQNLQNILDDVQNRLNGKGGDGFQHIETPFGGGKTHAMIALYHSANDWGAHRVVIVGTSMDPEQTIWGMIEEQLDGKIDKMTGKLAPGREKIRNVLEKHDSVLILIDELLPYVSTAAGVRIENTTLATQTITFIQQLSEAVSTLPRVCIVASFPASVYEAADKDIAEELLLKIQKVSGRKERKIVPIEPADIPNIIRSRLFSTPENEIKKNAQAIISDFADYCEKESILPPKMSAIQYREKFEQTYPFLPQVIDTLYQNWGSYSSFQRTRGVLRLLSMVIYSQRDSDRPYITLADFDLKNDAIRRELLAHIGSSFDSVIEKDITDPASASMRVEKDIGATYRGMHLGTRASTAIFMHSFSIGDTKGATMNQIKRGVSDIDHPSSIVVEVVEKFKRKLSYFKTQDDRYLFSSDPNINRLKMNKMENIKESEILEAENDLLASNLGSRTKIQTKIWPTSKDVEDSPTLKIVILNDDNKSIRDDIIENKGESAPRIYRNSIFFLCAADTEKADFIEHLKNRIALEKILPEIQSNNEQKKDVEDELRKEKSLLNHIIKKYYRSLYVPIMGDYKKYDMGIPTIGASSGISDHILTRLADEQEIHEKIGSLVLKNEYLKLAKFAKTSSMYEQLLKTRGNRRPQSRYVIEESIIDGVSNGTFGLGELIDDEPSCNFFKQKPSVSFAENEIIIHDSLCKLGLEQPLVPKPGKLDEPEPPPELARDSLNLEFNIPEGGMSDVWGIMRLINTKFNSIQLSIMAKDGAITKSDLKTIHESFREIGIDLDI